MSTDDSKDSITAIDTRFGLDARQLEQTLGTALARKSDFADLYFELRESTHVGLEEGLVKRANVSISQGVGVRVLAEEKTGYAYSDEITPEALELAAASARTIAHGSSAERRIAVRTGIASPSHNLYPIDAKGVSRPLPDRIDLLQKIDKEARKFDSRICNVMANLAIEEKQILVTNSEGTHRCGIGRKARDWERRCRRPFFDWLLSRRTRTSLPSGS